MKDYRYLAIKLTEEIGAKSTDLDEAIEAIHYDPEGVDAGDIETLEEIQRLIGQATELAVRVSK